MTDLDRVKQFHDWLKDKYEIEQDLKEHLDFNQRLTVGEKGDWFWKVYLFKDGKLSSHYITE